MRPTSRLLAALLTLFVVTATAAFAQAPPPGPAAISPERRAAIEAVFSASIPVEELEPSAAEYAALVRACNALNGSDVLLARFGDLCRANVRTARELDAFVACRTTAGCLRVTARLRRAIAVAVSRTRQLNRVLPAQLPDARCRAALRTSMRTLLGIARADRVLQAYARSLRGGSRREVLRAVDRLLLSLRDLPDTAQERRRFRNGCGPP